MKSEIIVPNSLNDIPLHRYQEFAKIAQKSEGEFVSRKMVSIFTQVPLMHVARMKMYSFNEVVDHFNTLFEVEPQFQQTFTLESNGKKIEFGFIPDLEDITLDEYADLDNYINDWEQMNRAMAVCYRPIKSRVGDKYTIEDYNGTDEYYKLMEFTPLDIVMGARVFFWNLLNELVKSTRLSLITEMEEMVTPKKKSFKRGGDGTQVFTHLQKEMLDILKKSENFELPKLSHF
jgi:hypothetical protein